MEASDAMVSFESSFDSALATELSVVLLSPEVLLFFPQPATVSAIAAVIVMIIRRLRFNIVFILPSDGNYSMAKRFLY